MKSSESQGILKRKFKNLIKLHINYLAKLILFTSEKDIKIS